MARVDTSKYEAAHGRKPRGYGTWWFDIGGEKVCLAGGTYGRAIKSAKTRATAKKALVITVLS